MAHVVPDRVKETTTTSGTGTVTLAGAVAGFQSFAAVGDGNTTEYVIVDGSSWETGIGTYTASGTTLARTQCLSSSNSGSKITLSGGSAEVFVSRVAAAINSPRGWIDGCTLSNNGTDAVNDIDVAAGLVRDDTDKVDMRLSASITKQLDAAWAVGSAAGGLDTGAVANGTYHVYVIMRPDTRVVDVLFSASASSPTMPANYIYKRRIGSILRESAAIVVFTQVGDAFMRAPVLDVSAGNPGASAVTRTLSVPTGVVVYAAFNASLYDSGDATESTALFSALSMADVAASKTGSPLGQLTIESKGTTGAPAPKAALTIATNTSAQIRSRLTGSAATTTLYIATTGWIDQRGRNA